MDQEDLATEQALEGVGARLLQAIQHLGISQSEFARGIDGSPGFISDVGRGMKKPGAELLCAARLRYGLSTDWLLTGTGTMFGEARIDLELFRQIRLFLALTHAAIVQQEPTGRAVLELVRDGRLEKGETDPVLAKWLSQLDVDAVDGQVVAELYNSHVATPDPQLRRGNLLAAAIAYWETRRPFDAFEALRVGPGIQINIGHTIHAPMRRRK
ncbi:helix-turn-helix transcriptional regulator [Niveibacterium sp. SC-1]|uniref:helix-turn-helix domain-containing protein n=1 Tax=Niveibacterium sp. SC-1 TaxID=3135646 RepID=UPI00311D3DE9